MTDCYHQGCVRTEPGHKIHSTSLMTPKSSAVQRRIHRALTNVLTNLAEEFERDGMLTAAERTRAKIPKDT